MFDIAPTELLIVGVVALLVIGPKDLPKAMRFVGNWMGKARRMASHFRAGVDNMMREAELEDLKKEWEEQNRRIMAQFPTTDDMTPTMKESNPGFPEGAPEGGQADGAGSAGDDAVNNAVTNAPQSPNLPPESKDKGGA